VDYFAFMLENLALAILHSSCLVREIRQVSVVPRPVDYASNEEHKDESVESSMSL
jgi:hypothetical protein